MSTSADLRPIAFVVMPFRKRPIPDPGADMPREVDFDALWDRALEPVLRDLGYLPVRADFDPGAIIVKDMFERLAFADLVLADLTIPNGNVYYEIGIRHVARRTRCVLVAAQWSRQLFDVDQMRCVRYDLRDGNVPREDAERIQDTLKAEIPKLRDSLSPFHELVRDEKAHTVFREQIEILSGFQTKVRAARLEKDSEKRRTGVDALLAQYQGACLDIPEVVLELVALVRDACSWDALDAFIASLPPAMQRHAFIREQKLLAQSERGDHQVAIAGLEQLIATRGETPERRGLLGGRYKRLWRAAKAAGEAEGADFPSLEAAGYLDMAIENYRTGMMLDLNEYYCASNLPGLLNARNRPGDADEAAFLDRFLIMTTHRKIERGEDDGWARATLLGAAFRAADEAEIGRLMIAVAAENPALWQLKSTLQDIRDTVDGVADDGARARLMALYRQLASLAGH